MNLTERQKLRQRHGRPRQPIPWPELRYRLRDTYPEAFYECLDRHVGIHHY